MATLTAATVINQCRILTATPAQSQGRWSDTSILSLVDMAQKHLVQETLFPESRLTGTAVSNLQYYPIPDSHRVYRVWVNGQICTRTDGSIETWQGMQIGFNDQTGQGAPVGGSAAAGGGTIAQPQWAIITPVAYPYLSDYGPPVNLTGPSFVGDVPRYTLDSGNILFSPAPANAATITIDGVFVPPDLTIGNVTQPLLVPVYYYDAITWYVVMMMKFADDTSSTQDQRNFAETKFQEHLKKLRTTIRQFKRRDTTTFVRTDRWVYDFGRNVTGDYGSSNE